MISFLLHLYQPSYQDEAIFKKIYEQSYKPLLKFIQSNKEFNITLNVPLSTLELMDTLGYEEWISQLAKLIEIGRVELVGSAAYHPLLTKVPAEHAEKQIILNEYALGYYFGKRHGFEGEKAILIKDLNGFFPPELAINLDILKILIDLGYKWALVDETALAESDRGFSKYTFENSNMTIAVRNRQISNQLAFKRDTIAEDLPIYDKDVILALDAETFGHHNTEGIRLLDNIYRILRLKDIPIRTVSQFLDSTPSKAVSTILESTWGASDYDMHNEHPYVFWDNKDNNVQQLLWKVLNSVLNNAKDSSIMTIRDDEDILPLWITRVSKNKQNNTDYVNGLHDMLSIFKLSNSDQFWWSSNKKLVNNVVLYSALMLNKSCEKYSDYANKNIKDTNDILYKDIIGDIDKIRADIH